MEEATTRRPLWEEPCIRGLLLNHLLASNRFHMVALAASTNHLMLYAEGNIRLRGETITMAEAIAAEPSVEDMLSIVTPCNHAGTMAVLEGRVWKNADAAEATTLQLELDDDLQRRFVAGLLLEEVLQHKVEFNLHCLWHDPSRGAFARGEKKGAFNYVPNSYGNGPWRNTWELTGMLEDNMDWWQVLPEILEQTNAGRLLRGAKPLELVASSSHSQEKPGLFLGFGKDEKGPFIIIFSDRPRM